MLAAAALALSLLGSHDEAQITTRSLATGDWVTKIHTDRFTGEVTCALTGRAMSFHRDTLVFHLGRNIDSGQAFFRIDGGPARSVREPRIENETHGFFLDSGPINNPSGGRVALPFSLVQNAKQVLIRASPKRSPRAFDVGELGDALSAAKTAGCKEASF